MILVASRYKSRLNTAITTFSMYKCIFLLVRFGVGQVFNPIDIFFLPAYHLVYRFQPDPEPEPRLGPPLPPLKPPEPRKLPRRAAGKEPLWPWSSPARFLFRPGVSALWLALGPCMGEPAAMVLILSDRLVYQDSRR